MREAMLVLPPIRARTMGNGSWAMAVAWGLRRPGGSEQGSASQWGV